MNTELFIARKVFSSKENKKGISSRIVSIAVGSISLGLIVMLVSVAILVGFKNQIREKVFGFSAHFQIVNFDSNASFESTPITVDSTFFADLLAFTEIESIYPFASKLGIIKTETDIQEMVLKGIDKTYDLNFFKKNLIEGELPNFDSEEKTNDVLISSKISRSMALKVGSNLYCYFWNEGESYPRSARFTVKGIYETSLDEFDKMFVIGDLRQVQRLYGWSKNEITGLEINLTDYRKIEALYLPLRDLGLAFSSDKSMYRVQAMTEKYSFLFDWLDLIDMNVIVLLLLMLTVAGINMISGLLIIIIERTRMVGILKAMGYPNVNIRKVFLYLSAFLSMRGMLWGNIIGIGICILQASTGIITLDPASYYIDMVPIELNFGLFLLINLGTLVSIVAMVIIPTMFISRISPIEAIGIE